MDALDRATAWTLATLFGLFICHSWFGPDIWYHLSWGRRLVEYGEITPQQVTLLTQPIHANMYWLFQGFIYLAYTMGGIYFVSTVFIAVWIVTAALFLKIARPPLVVALIALLLVQLRFEHRPEVFSYLFLSLMLWRYSRLSESFLWNEAIWLFLIQVLWSNTHGYFILGPILALVHITAKSWSTRRLAYSSLAYAAIVLTATLVTPFGEQLWKAVMAYAQLGPALKDVNQELFAPSLGPPWLSPMTLYWLWLLAAAILAGHALWKNENQFAAILALVGVALSLQAVRHIPLAVFLAAPIWIRLPQLKSRGLTFVTLLATLTVLGGVASGAYARVTGSLSHPGIYLEATSYPIAATEFLRSQNFQGKIFCDSYDGGYLGFFIPDIRIAGDSYFADAETTRMFYTAIRSPKALMEIHERIGFDALLINVENLEVIDHLLQNKLWSLVYNDSHRAVFYPSFKAKSYNPATASYWPGRDLTDPNYAFGPMSWAAIARRYRWRDVLLKIAQDLKPATVIPATIAKSVLATAIDLNDQELARAGLELASRARAKDDVDLETLRQMQTKVEQCCR